MQSALTQKRFSEDLKLNKSAFGRFMGSGKETTGIGSSVYPVLNEFFVKRHYYTEFTVGNNSNGSSSSSSSSNNSSSNNSRAAPYKEDVGPAPTIQTTKRKRSKIDADDYVVEANDVSRSSKSKRNSNSNYSNNIAAHDALPFGSSSSQETKKYLTSDRKRESNRLYKQSDAYKQKLAAQRAIKHNI